MRRLRRCIGFVRPWPIPPPSPEPSPKERRAGGEGKTTSSNGIGVFWQTQGSGKSFSMVFFAQKVLRKVAGNWTFLGVTDRVELDDQIAKLFKATGAVSEKLDSQELYQLKMHNQKTLILSERNRNQKNQPDSPDPASMSIRLTAGDAVSDFLQPYRSL